MIAEQIRLDEARTPKTPWKKWGPYLSERQWGTVREDYSDGGDAWNYFSHDQARSRAYRWGEDGRAGISDDRQQLCFALALWNGKDPIIKERLFGLTNSEGNHGEDVKEYYFYLDSTPTHSYMKYLYKYPQAAFPYDNLVQTNRQRPRTESEYDLIDTGVFDDNRYFDVFVEYAKESPEDILIQISIYNRGPDTADLHVLPTLCFRNEWSWGGNTERPNLEALPGNGSVVKAAHPILGEYYLACEGDVPLLFTENETKMQRIFGAANRSPYVKDGINNYLVHGQKDAVNPEKIGTKVAADYRLTVNAGACRTVRLRLSKTAPKSASNLFADFDDVLECLHKEADQFYDTVIPPSLNDDEANVMRQALAGMLWSKQFYHYDVHKWLEERGSDPFKENGKPAHRNDHWYHLNNGDIISMPDKWEYPWYAAWDLAFHVMALTLVDPDFGKEQLQLMVRERYLHPNGQIPAYEWNFGDVNPPVHAWSTIFTYRLEIVKKGAGDRDWLRNVFHKLLLNFTWWVNRKDRFGRNVFEGGFLGLDNIGVFDRSAPLPTGGCLEQADGTTWMCLFCENMLEIAAELARTDEDYADLAVKFVQHFLWIASSMTHVGETGMWDEEDGFFYNVLQLSNGKGQRLKVRSMVGLLPLCAATVFDGLLLKKYPELTRCMETFLRARPEVFATIHSPYKPGVAGRLLASILDETKLRRVLAKMLDEKEFLSPFGIRSLSRYHADHPYTFHVGGQEYRVSYLPAESDSGMFGGISIWRGPVWAPVNALLIRALLEYYAYYGNDFKVECPTGSGRQMTLYQVAEEIARRLASIFLKDNDGRRPVYGSIRKFQEDPYWRDLIQFHEYFHGDNGTGLGASHQTGWTGMVARGMHLFATSDAEEVLQLGKMAFAHETEKPPVRQRVPASANDGNKQPAP
jgi:hypothetical protein